MESSPEHFKKILELVSLAERLKVERRNSRTSFDTKESVADHSWRVALLAMLLAPTSDLSLDIEKVLKMAIIHDLPEIFAGDVPYFLTIDDPEAKSRKDQKECEAIEQIRDIAGGQIGEELYLLWHEYDECQSTEAKFVKALDKVEAQMQHNQADFRFWNEHDLKYAMTWLNSYCDFSDQLNKVRKLVQQDSSRKIGGHSLAPVWL